MKTNAERNVRVIAENNGNRNGFSIYLVFSGQREYLMDHRHDGLTFSILKDGIMRGELARLVPQKCGITRSCSRNDSRKRAEHLSRSLKHLNSAIDEYIDDMRPAAADSAA